MEVPLDATLGDLTALIADDAGMPRHGVDYFLGDTLLKNNTTLLKDTRIAQQDCVYFGRAHYPEKNTPIVRSQKQACLDVVISPDGAKVLVTTSGDKAVVYDIHTEGMLREYDTGCSEFNGFVLSHFGADNATVFFMDDSTMQLHAANYKTDATSRVFPLEGKVRGIDDVGVDQVAVIATDEEALTSTLAIWDVTTFTVLRVITTSPLNQHEDFSFLRVSVAPSAEYCIMGGQSGLRRCDLTSNDVVVFGELSNEEDSEEDSSEVCPVYLHVKALEGERCLTTLNGIIQLWDVKSRTKIRSLTDGFSTPHTDDDTVDSSEVEILSCSVAGDMCVATQLGTSRIIIWDLETGQVKKRLESAISALVAVCVGPCGTFFISGGSSSEEEDSEDIPDSFCALEMWR